MSSRTAGIVLAIAIAVFIAVDVVLALDPVAGNTWTERVRAWSSATLVVPYAAGVLLGHFFGFWLWRWSFAGVVLSLGIPALAGIFIPTITVELQALAAGVGFFVGGLLWGRRRSST